MASSNHIIEGVEFVALQAHTDERGKLIILEEHKGLPFIPRRIFYITQPDITCTRACHSGSSEELINVLSGSVTVDFDNGTQQTTMHLTDNGNAVWIRPGVWLRLKNFSPDAIVVVAASLTYAETIHFDYPNFPYNNN